MDRIQAGNRAYYANLKLLKSKLLLRKGKLQIYITLIRPVITYGAETWTLTKEDQNTLRKFERKIMRKIYGPMMENGEWRIRLKWLGHLERMGENRIPLKVHKAKIYSVRRKGRPRTRWMDDVMEDIRIMKIRGWREKINDRGGLESDCEGGQDSHRAIAPYSK
ncbi:hypothetical protein C0J52_26615 [Blattella germanica]|nr:hypothetical protein C0J52_26615 [Blattella germanica]